MIRTLAATSLLAGAAMAQVGSPLDIAQQALMFLSSDCQQAVLSIANSSSPVYQCLQIDSLLPAITTNGSIIEPVDDYLSAICYNEPCSPELMNQTATQFIQACGSDLAQFGVDNSTIETVFGLYPLARDVVCLKNNETEALTNATVPIEQGGYNSTNGTFCLTELATNLTGYLGVNLTNSYIDTLALGGNATAIMNLTSIPPTALCSDCVFAAVSLIEEQYPEAGNIVVDRQSNTTINSFLNSTCEASDLSVSRNGTLPEGIDVAAINGTESYTLPSITGAPMMTATGLPASMTGAPAAAISEASSAVAPPAAPSAPAGQMAEKRRWVGQQ